MKGRLCDLTMVAMILTILSLSVSELPRVDNFMFNTLTCKSVDCNFFEHFFQTFLKKFFRRAKTPD